ncbi:hypothetical protein L1049_009354 [Liquidambar formosana]|uniref:Uncharacterized protein n=1 Tax=Liquidambar formosana TaxID=63359 RepID=A0AAP0SB83_LIQFO
MPCFLLSRAREVFANSTSFSLFSSRSIRHGMKYLFSQGLVSITISAVLPSLRPTPCPTQENCKEASALQLCVLYICLLLTGLGASGIRPCVLPFAADQFDMTKSRVSKRSWNFFNWFYFSLRISALTALTFIVYVQDNVSWGWGFGIPTISMAVSILVFVTGSPLYKKVKPEGSPFVRLAQVLVAAMKKRKAIAPADPGLLYENKELDAAISLQGRLLHTNQFKWFDRAAIVTDSDATDSNPPNLWRISTVHRVEELKSIIRMLPIWAAGILLVTSSSHQQSFTIIQARTMDRHLSHSFQIPPASLSVISVLTTLIGIVLYERLFVPFARRFTGNPSGMTCLQRMGIGFIINILATLVASFVEIKRKAVAANHNLLDKPTTTIPVSVFWLVPQFVLHGVADIFMSVGHMEFLYDQSPESMRSSAVALYWMTVSVGNYVATLLVSLVHKYSGKKENWLPDRNLNRGRLEYYYWLVTGIQVINLIYYLICSYFYNYKPLEEVIETSKENDADLTTDKIPSRPLNGATNEICDRFATTGFDANMITYLTQELNLPMGLVSITISAVLPSLRPPPCPTQENCKEASALQLWVLYICLLLTCLGSGGIRPCVLPFAADQFDMTKSTVSRRSWNFFNWFYFSMGMATLTALTVVVYVQENVSWGWGLGIPTIGMALSIVAFVIGSPLYKNVKPGGSPFVRLAQVVVAAVKKRKVVAPADPGLLYENKELDAAISLQGRLLHTNQFKWLDSAAIVTDADATDSNRPNLWRLATVHRVEELKSIIRMLPIWAAGILLITSSSHQYSFTIIQARTMDRHLSHSFQIPPASLSIISVLTMLIGIVLYERLFVPFARQFTGNPSGITCLQRMGIGFMANILATLVASFVEIKRKEVAADHNLLDKPTAIIPITNEICDRFANTGFHANIITYLTQELNLPLGLVTITVSAVLPSLRPPPCPTQENCKEASALQLWVLYICLLLTSLGSGGIRPCVLPFAADQFDMTQSMVSRPSWNFFNWFYFSMGMASLTALTIIVYVQDNVSWGWGLGIPTIGMALSTVAFVSGSPLYKKLKPGGSPFVRLAQVLVAAVQKRKAVAPANPGLLYENKELDAAISLQGRLLHTNQFNWFDRAAIVTDADAEESNPPNLWRLATVHRVEELKSIVRMLPIWAAGILLITSSSNQHSFTILQARTMDRHLSHSFQIPPASLSIFSVLTMLIGIVLYERLFVPFARRFTGNPSGITCLQRMGIGFMVNILSTIVASLVETKRKAVAANHNLLDKPTAIIPISVFWLVPQFSLHGVAEVFMSVGPLNGASRDGEVELATSETV